MMDIIDSEDDSCPSSKRFQVNTSTPRFLDEKGLPGETPSSLGTAADVGEDIEEIEYRNDVEEATPDALPLRYLSSKRFNTTSTVYASETIESPDINQVLFCLGSVLQAQMVEDSEASPAVKAAHPDFDILIDLKPEFGGIVDLVPDHVLDHDACDDDDLRYKLKNNIVPSVDTITRYIGFLASVCKLTVEVNIIALVYVNRLASNCNLVLTMNNWRSVWLTCVILAQKMWNDRAIKSGAFAKVLKLEKSVIRNIEARALQLLEYSVGVKPSLYVKYYFELRQLFTTIMGFKMSEWRVKPLSVRQAYRLEALSKKMKAKMSPALGDNAGVDAMAMEKSSTSGGDRGEDKSTKRGDKKGIANSLEDATFKSQARFVIS